MILDWVVNAGTDTVLAAVVFVMGYAKGSRNVSKDTSSESFDYSDVYYVHPTRDCRCGHSPTSHSRDQKGRITGPCNVTARKPNGEAKGVVCPCQGMLESV